MIRNTANGRIYIGSSFNMPARWRGHRNALHRGKHENKHLQNAWHKYGADAFSWTTLLICEPVDRLFYEQRYIDVLQVVHHGYNKCPTAGSAKGLVMSLEGRAKISIKKRGVPMTPEHRAAHAAAMARPEVRAKIASLPRGRKLSPEHRAAIGIAGTGKRRAARSQEWRIKLSMAGRGKTMPPEQRAKIAATLTGQKRPLRSAAMMGTRLSESHRAAISAGHQRRRERLTMPTNDSSNALIRLA